MAVQGPETRAEELKSLSPTDDDADWYDCESDQADENPEDTHPSPNANPNLEDASSQTMVSMTSHVLYDVCGPTAACGPMTAPPLQFFIGDDEDDVEVECYDLVADAACQTWTTLENLYIIQPSEVQPAVPFCIGEPVFETDASVDDGDSLVEAVSQDDDVQPDSSLAVPVVCHEQESFSQPDQLDDDGGDTKLLMYQDMHITCANQFIPESVDDSQCNDCVADACAKQLLDRPLGPSPRAIKMRIKRLVAKAKAYSANGYDPKKHDELEAQLLCLEELTDGKFDALLCTIGLHIDAAKMADRRAKARAAGLSPRTVHLRINELMAKVKAYTNYDPQTHDELAAQALELGELADRKDHDVLDKIASFLDDVQDGAL